MRIALVTPDYGGVTPAAGGIGSQFAALAGELARRGHDVHVVTQEGDPPPGHGPSIRVFESPGDGVLWRLRDALAVDRVLASLGDLDVVFAPEWAGMAWRYARRRGRAPVVTNLATSSAQVLALAPDAPRRAHADPRVLLPRLLERSQAKRSDAIVACSSAVLSWARDLWPIDRVPQSVIPNAIDLDGVRRHASEPSLAGRDLGDGPVMAVPGRLEPRKGSHVLAAALPLVAEQVPDARVLLLGKDGHFGERPMSEHMRSLAGPHADRLTFLGHQTPERLFALLARADVVTTPSLWEAFGIATLEAMAIGRPVVVTSGSGFDDFCRDGENALAVPPDDAPALAAALVRLLTDAALADRLGAAARATADEYGIETVTDRFVDLFERL